MPGFKHHCHGHGQTRSINLASGVDDQIRGVNCGRQVWVQTNPKREAMTFSAPDEDFFFSPSPQNAR